MIGLALALLSLVLLLPPTARHLGNGWWNVLAGAVGGVAMLAATIAVIWSTRT
jgi:hypothetical protein